MGFAFDSRIGLPRRARRFLSEQGDPGTGRVTLEIGADGIRGTRAGNTGHYVWSSVQRVERGEAVTYVYVTSVAALVIPDRAFPDDVSRDAFWGEFDRLRREAAARQQPA